MTNRLVGLFVMPVRAPEEPGKGSAVEALKADIKLFRNALKEIRLRKVMKPVLGGVEFFEFGLTEHGRSWNLHCHTALDVVAVDVVDVEAAFKHLTKGRGWFSVPPDHENKIVTHDNIDRTSTYFAKSTTWSPEPGSRSLRQLDVLQQSIKGVQLVTMWGTAAPKAPKVKRDRATVGVPKTKRPKRVPFFLYPDDLKLMEAAICRASELSNSDCRSHNLALVCMNYIATNDFNITDEAQRLRFLATFERFIGFRLIAWAPETDQIVHGYNTVRMLARRADAPAPEHVAAPTTAAHS